ncbi:probable 6-phosphogluconolactonase 4, chloroplastic [Sesamum indicum]|uniref:Probable 6-phosphogluconolactonase n=1 Tax=Sesamum indicum TaxID=4182 RepID=A0A6I9SZN7_SESIN|nr:probable 6-phosphogluconolactonase 4, chloroplastic [Sesamum indicum]
MAPKMRNQNVIILPTEEDVAMGLAPYVAGLSEKNILEKGSFTVVLSGGTLIQTLRKLTQSPYKETVNWSRWFIFWVDERVVPLDNPDSNYLLAWNGFLSKVPIPSSNIYPIHYCPSSEVVAKDYQFQLLKLVERKVLPLSPTGFPQFDLMLLGIGPDGHVASLFPNRPQRYDKTDWVTYINDSPKPPPKRITFTFPVINSANNIAMVVTDKEEADAVAITLENIPVRPPLPCSEVKAQVLLTWFLDKDAASKLAPKCNK